MKINDLSAVELGRKIKSGEISACDAVEAVFENIEKKEAQLNCYITLDKEGALRKAKEVQKLIDDGLLSSPIAGVPIAIKDNICTKGMLTTCASKILSDFVPVYSAQAVTNLEKAGAIIIGKTNMDEFAMGSTTETSFYGATKNPMNPDYVSGGSSGGSAAAVAAGECFFSLGSDTGGSIRQPSSFCGVVGMKPTYGTVSRYGLIAYASSLDQIGPITKDVTDCAMVMELLLSDADMENRNLNAGKNESKGDLKIKDSTFIKRDDCKFTDALIEDVQGLRIGIPKTYLKAGIDENVKNSVILAAELFESKNAKVCEFDLDLVDYAIPAYYIIASAEASSNLARFDGVKYGYRAENYEGLHQMYKKTRSEGFGTEVKRRIMLGSFVLSSGYYDEYYIKALKTRRLIKEEFNKAFEKYDIILGPVAPTTAPLPGKSLCDPIKMYLGDIYTVSANLAGLPAISIPCGKDKNGLPIGVQLMADCFKEKTLFKAAFTLEQGIKKN